MSAAHLEKLNEGQRAAVVHGIGLPDGKVGGPLLIIAGAGSGKPAFYRAIEGYRRGNFRKPENSCAVIGGYGRCLAERRGLRSNFLRDKCLFFFHKLYAGTTNPV